MPSGARTIEHGRPLRGPIIHSPTASKYCARSSFVTPSPSPASGHSALSGFEITTPMTSPVLLLAAGVARTVALLVLPLLLPGFGCATPALDGVSASTSSAGLSWRRPLNAA